MNANAILRNTFHHSAFSDIRKLIAAKEKQGLRISLAFPTLNEEKTIGKEILIIKTELMERFPLIDEISVVDSGSTDSTLRIAAEFGARVFKSADILRRYGSFQGKGENLWKSLHILTGDIIVWVDADIKNIHPKFVYGLVGPLLEDAGLSYIKAFYERPMTINTLIEPGGGRVTEILVRPLLSIFYPELTQLLQPLSGEYAARRALLERLPFSVGYGVEIGHLIDIYHSEGAGVIGQVDLDRRIHRNQTVNELGRMSFGILHTFFNRLEKYYNIDFDKIKNMFYERIRHGTDGYGIDRIEVQIRERDPIITLREYKEKFIQTPGARRNRGPIEFLRGFFSGRRHARKKR